MASNGLKTIAGIFESKVFRIPDYQRGYSWTKKQLNDFWEDLENLPDDHIHYTGVLTLEPVNSKNYSQWENDLWLMDGKGYSPYYVVDGQQRLTTVIILIQTILEKVNEEEQLNYTSKKEITEKYISQSKDGGVSKTFIFGYEKDNPSYEFLKTQIFGVESNANQDIETLYTANLEFAKKFFKKNIENLSVQETESLFKKITLSLKFNVYEIEEDLDVFVAFETMNNRGKKLSHLELMKNRIIYLSTLLKTEQYEKDSLRRNINDAWKTIYEYLGKNKKDPLDDDTYLKNHWIMYFKYSRKTANDYIDFLLEEHFTAKNVLKNKLSATDIQKYITSIQDSVKVWYFIHNPSLSDYDPEIKKWLIKLNNLGFVAFKPLVMAILHKVKEIDSNDIVEILKTMEKYIFLIFRISRRPANTGDSEFYRFAKDFYYDDLSIDGIKVKITEWIDRYRDEKNFFDYIKDLFEIQENGFYGWNGLKYVLYEYDYSLQEGSKEEHRKIDWKEFNKEINSIEHIYPQTSEQECWDKYFSDYSKDEKSKLRNSLGNLLPLAQRKNSSLQNDCFDKKKRQDSGEIGYFNGSYSENEVAQKENWAPKEILERGLKIIGFMEKRWDISFGSDEDKKELLHVNFLKK